MLFGFAFMIKLILQVIYLLGAQKFHWSELTYVIMEVIGHCVVDLLPISYMIYCHHVTY